MKIISLIILILVAAALIAGLYFIGRKNDGWCFGKDCDGLQCTVKSSIVAIVMLVIAYFLS